MNQNKKEAHHWWVAQVWKLAVSGKCKNQDLSPCEIGFPWWSLLKFNVNGSCTNKIWSFLKQRNIKHGLAFEYHSCHVCLYVIELLPLGCCDESFTQNLPWWMVQTEWILCKCRGRVWSCNRSNHKHNFLLFDFFTTLILSPQNLKRRVVIAVQT